MNNETSFLLQFSSTLAWMEATLSATLAEMAVNATAGGGNASTSDYCDVASVAAQRPLLVWMGGTRLVFSDSESSWCHDDNIYAQARRMAWKVDELFEKYRDDFHRRRRRSSCRPFRDVVFMARHELTSPLHTGNEFGHFHYHYGTTRGICIVNAQRGFKYSFDVCLRNATADWQLMQWWLNALDTSR